jgi:hypothetical protein
MDGDRVSFSLRLPVEATTVTSWRKRTPGRRAVRRPAEVRHWKQSFSGTAPDRAHARRTRDLAFSGSSIEEAVMIHRPKTVYGYVFLFLLAIVVAAILVTIVASQWSTLVLGIIGVVALASLVTVLWRRRVEAERERAWVGSFSFGDVVARMKAREAAHGG